MKKMFFVFVILFGSIAAFGQSSTSALINLDQYDWHKLNVTHNLDKNDSLVFHFWFKQSTDAKRFRAIYQRKLIAYAKEKTTLQITAGIGASFTSRKRRTMSKQIFVPAEVLYRYKINKDLSFSARIASSVSISPKASLGDHSSKSFVDAGFKYKKVNMLYHAQYLAGFQAGLRENYQGAMVTYDVSKKLTMGGYLYTDLKQAKRSAHFALSTIYRF